MSFRNKGQVRRISIRTKLIILVLSIMIPTNVMTFFVGQNILKQTQELYQEAQQTELTNYLIRAETRMNTMISYLNLLMNSDTYTGITLDRDKVDYQLAKTSLWREIENMSLFFDMTDLVYAYFPGTEEGFAYYETSVISIEEYKTLYPVLHKAAERQGWSMEEIGEKRYLRYSIQGKSFNMGFLVKETTLLGGLMVSGDQEYILISEEMYGEKTRDIYPVCAELPAEGFYIASNTAGSSRRRAALPLLYYILVAMPFFGIISVMLCLITLRRSLLQPLDVLAEGVRKQNEGQIDYRLTEFDSSRELYEIQISFNEMLDNINDLKIDTYELQIENQRTQLINLQLQLNPHFLMNSLNTIYSLVQVKKYDEIQPYVFNLINYLRYSIGNSEVEVELKKELEFVDFFTAIQKVRFPNRFRLIYNVDEELLSVKVMRLLIENFVENSIKHGVIRGKILNIIVTVKKREDRLVITVCDDGQGIAPETLKEIREGKLIHDSAANAHVGIWNCIRRLRLFYENDAVCAITSAPGEGTQIYIELPAERGDVR